MKLISARDKFKKQRKVQRGKLKRGSFAHIIYGKTLVRPGFNVGGKQITGPEWGDQNFTACGIPIPDNVLTRAMCKKPDHHILCSACEEVVESFYPDPELAHKDYTPIDYEPSKEQLDRNMYHMWGGPENDLSHHEMVEWASGKE